MGSLDKSLFVTDEILPRQVKLSDGNEHTLHFRQLSAVAWRRVFLGASASDDRNPALIAACLCEPDGTAAITIEQASQLTTDAEAAIVTEILKINGRGEQGKA